METTDPIDTSHLDYSFQDQWRPKTIDDYTNAYINKMATPTMIVDDIIAKIKRVNGEMNIFVDWSETLIKEQAAESERRYQSGKQLGPFDGVPVVIKDQLDIKGLTTRCGVEVEGKVIKPFIKLKNSVLLCFDRQ